MESLLSTSPLMVAAAPDMDLMGCVEHFLQHCVDDKGQIAPKFAEMPVENLSRGGCKKHVLTTDDIPKLRKKAKKCLQVRFECFTMQSLRLTLIPILILTPTLILFVTLTRNTLTVVGARPGPPSH